MQTAVEAHNPRKTFGEFVAVDGISWERLEKLRSRGITILLTTHYMDEAFRLCDRLVITDHGRILVEGKPGDLVKRYVGKNVLEVAEPTKERPR